MIDSFLDDVIPRHVSRLAGDVEDVVPIFVLGSALIARHVTLYRHFTDVFFYTCEFDE